MEYSLLVSFYEGLEKTTKRLEKTYIIAKLLQETKEEDLLQVIYLLQGRVFPAHDSRELGVSSRLVIKAISQATGANSEHIEMLWAEIGDLGLVAEKLISSKKQTTLFSSKLSVKKVFSNLQALATLEGKGTVAKKISLVAELLTNSSSNEAKFIIRTILSQLRVGIAEGILRDAISWTYFPKVVGIFFKCDKCKQLSPKSEKCLNCNEKIDANFKTEIQKPHKNCMEISSIEEIKKQKNKIRNYDCIIAKDEKTAREIYNNFISQVQELYDMCNDFGQVAIALKNNSTVTITINPGTPINPMLAVRLDTLKEVFEALGSPVLVEYKLDGFRLQIHCHKDKFWFFTRNLENVLNQFEELIPVIKDNVKGNSFILDCEIVGHDPKSKKYLPFQNISQRIKRKYDIEKTAKEIPVEINVFDIIYLNGKDLLNLTQKERRAIIEKIIAKVPGKITTTNYSMTSSLNEIGKFYKESLKRGNEGIMLKNLSKKYTPGRRVGGWMKFKPNLEPLDLVIVGATYGEGKRAAFLSSYVLACKNNNKLLECGMSSSGLKEKKEEGLTYEEMTKLLESLITKKEGRNVIVKPKLIVEVIYEEIQKSPTYSSGYALRFPRIKNLRTDKPLKDIATLEDLERVYEKQRGRNTK
ncbi:ATP-dependent DNA ligase [Candidatus Woesearchaeota archaeon]|nr:ATP-dependent DNA ligase [Candidatus Woesearchaeota archaeon]